MSRILLMKRIVGMSPIPSIMRRMRESLRVVLYHHVGDENDFTRHLGCTTSEENFEAHIDWYARNYDIVSLEDVVGEDPWPRRPLLITFDDAYRSTRETSGRILRSRGLPSVLFLLTDPVFRRRMVLDNLLSFAFCRRPASVEVHGKGPASDPVRNILFHTIPTGGLEVRRRIREAVELEHGEEADRLAGEIGLYLRKEDLVELERSGMTIARHTASHVNMGILDDVAFEVEKEWNACGLDPNVKAFSLPFGGLLDAETSIPKLLSICMNPCFLVEGCFNQSRQNVYFRTSPKTESISGVNADLEVFGLIRRMRKKSRIEALENLAFQK